MPTPQNVSVSHVFSVGRDHAFETCLRFMSGPPDPQELIKKGAPSELVREATHERAIHRLPEIDRPRRYVVERTIGPATARLEMDFLPVTCGTKVIQTRSIHPRNLLGRVLTAISRRRLGGLASRMMEELSVLKEVCERGAPEPTREELLRRRGLSLLTGHAYFEVVSSSGADSDDTRGTARMLYESAKLHFILADANTTDVDLERVKENEIFPDFEERMRRGDGDSLSFFVDGFAYYIGWVKRLRSPGREGLESLHGIAKGERSVMGELVLKHMGPPSQEELERLTERMSVEPKHLLVPFAVWNRKRSQPDLSGR